MMDEFEEQPKRNIGQTITKWLGGNLTKERRDELYFGRPPKGAYPKHNDLAHIHDIRFSPEQIEKLYGISVGHKEEMALESVESDTRSDLMKELQAKGLTREEARQTIVDLLKAGVLAEVYDPDLREKVLVWRR